MHGEIPLAVVHSDFSAVQNDSVTPEVVVHKHFVRVALVLCHSVLSRVSPPWLCASRGHPGWSCSENTKITALPGGKVCLSSEGAYRDAYLRHVEWDWLTAVCVFVTSSHDKLR